MCLLGASVTGSMPDSACQAIFSTDLSTPCPEWREDLNSFMPPYHVQSLGHQGTTVYEFGELDRAYVTYLCMPRQGSWAYMLWMRHWSKPAHPRAELVAPYGYPSFANAGDEFSLHDATADAVRYRRSDDAFCSTLVARSRSGCSCVDPRPDIFNDERERGDIMRPRWAALG